MQAQSQTEDERAIHEGFMREALKMAEYALTIDETPVGCVIVHDRAIVARGQNATNATLNGTRHAEFIAIASLSSQGLNPASILPEADLYVTVEPCIMCASLLRQYGIRYVYYGASNERFGGTGGVLNIHEPEAGIGDGYKVSGGWLREEAILLLRRFYVQENVKAPEPRSKKDRKFNPEVEPLVRLEGSDAG